MKTVQLPASRLAYRDFFTSHADDADCSSEVVGIYRRQFPALFQAADLGEIKTAAGNVMCIGGDTLITYKSAIRRNFGRYFGQLRPETQAHVRCVLERYSITPDKTIRCFDYAKNAVVNNHQIGNMMPFPSGKPSLNILRAQGGLHDYFDRFLLEVRNFYARCSSFQPNSKLQVAIAFYGGYFDFFQTYERFIEVNLLQDFEDKNLWSITDFEEYVKAANEIIDARAKRFTSVPA